MDIGADFISGAALALGLFGTATALIGGHHAGKRINSLDGSVSQALKLASAALDVSAKNAGKIQHLDDCARFDDDRFNDFRKSTVKRLTALEIDPPNRPRDVKAIADILYENGFNGSVKALKQHEAEFHAEALNAAKVKEAMQEQELALNVEAV